MDLAPFVDSIVLKVAVSVALANLHVTNPLGADLHLPEGCRAGQPDMTP
jgi:hypothetical protein